MGAGQHENAARYSNFPHHSARCAGHTGFFVPLSTSDGALHGWRNPKAGSGVADPVEKGLFAACLRCFFSNAWADVGHEDGVDPVDDADVHVRTWNDMAT